ncbi:MAG: succinylglutamate desuccinylase/aspartoacylase family protein [Opitutaceae bacterium]|nr:succinylglutamate desuccinylase/aspartoacylase family protein [Opitutaceae bacterium]
MHLARLTLVLAAATALAHSADAPAPIPGAAPPALIPGLAFIDSNYENASPLWHEPATDGSVLVHLLYDHERASTNRAAGHIRFTIHGTPGARLTLEFVNLQNVYNGRAASVAPSMRTLSVSDDGRAWRVVPITHPAPGRARATVELTGPLLHVARIEPYGLPELAAFLAELRASPLTEITVIGKTVQGRDLEIVRLGDPAAPRRVFLRARAHPWEPGGNWVLQGLARRLLRGDADAKKFLARTCVWFLPMANKDGVAAGRTRFNALGKDLNRDWNAPADPALAPENAALERWLEGMIAAGRKPDLALELHNDGNGQLHVTRAPSPHLERHLARMAIFEKLLRRHTWFTEGATGPAFRNTGTLGEGWLLRFGIDAVVHEFNTNVITVAGEKVAPLGRHWEAYGESLATVFFDYFGETAP